MPSMNPIAFMIFHKEIIAPIHDQCKGKGKTQKTWEHLKKVLPELQQVMKFNTFKQYLSVLTAITSQLDEVELNTKQVRQQLDNQPKRILGWNVQKANDGYYRCYRKIHGQVRSIYIGKKLNVQKARRRIKEKETNIG